MYLFSMDILEFKFHFYSYSKYLLKKLIIFCIFRVQMLLLIYIYTYLWKIVCDNKNGLILKIFLRTE